MKLGTFIISAGGDIDNCGENTGFSFNSLIFVLVVISIFGSGDGVLYEVVAAAIEGDALLKAGFVPGLLFILLLNNRPSSRKSSNGS